MSKNKQTNGEIKSLRLRTKTNNLLIIVIPNKWRRRRVLKF